MNELTYWVALSSVKSMSFARKNTLLANLHARNASIADFFNATPESWRSLGILSEAELRQLYEVRTSLPNYAFVTEELVNQGYRMLPVMSPSYPAKIKQRLKYNSPILLYFRGNPKLFDEPSTTVFGSRSPSESALLFAAGCGASTLTEGKVLISGEAEGCDRRALDTILEHDGKAILVIPQGIMKFGTGFDRLYRHISGGRVMVLSCFPPDTYRSSDAANTRNSLILGLADDIYVACADHRGSTYSLLEGALRRGVRLKVRVQGSGELPGNDLLIASGGTPV